VHSIKHFFTIGITSVLTGTLVLYGAVRAADAPANAAAAKWQAIVDPDNSNGLWIMKDGRVVVKWLPGGWGAGWKWVGIPESKTKGDAGKIHTSFPFEVDAKAGQVIQTEADIAGDGKTVVCKYALTAANDVPTTMLMLSVEAGDWVKGTIVATKSDGSTETCPLPNPRQADLEKVTKAEFQLDDGGSVIATFDPPVNIGMENHNPRIKLAEGVYKAGNTAETITLSASGPLQFLASPQELGQFIKTLPGDDWYTFQPANDSGASVIGMEDWLDAPAGKHGGVRINSDHFQFEDGTPVKFWGTNLAYAQGAPSKPFADITAARFAKYGINAVRLHKFTGSGGWDGIMDPNDTLQMVPAGADRLDYFTSKLKEKGIYFGFSHTYGFQPGPANASKLLSYDEIKNNLNGNTYGLINFAPDIQDLLIQRISNILNHVNAYTKMKYADDPALAYVEIQNEDDIFWFSSGGTLAKCPTYMKDFQKRFADWLTKKYGTQDAVAKAWAGGPGAAVNLAAGDVPVQANPWFFSEDHLPNTAAGEKQWLLDNAAFMHQVQDDFYAKAVKAIRDAGFKGPICGSPWQAPSGLPDMLNLKSDYAVGFIDRHNYAGGNINYSLLSQIGSGYISSGFQQVIDRPFGISEWITNYPSLYAADGPAVFAVYGMGLQGWSSSYEFQSLAEGNAGFDTALGPPPFGVWQVDSPTQIGQFPALSRMIYRGDVKEGDIIADRRVSNDDLQTGKFNFSDKVVANGDVKNFGGNTPAAALAAGRVVVEFTDKEQASTFPDMTKYTDGTAIVSNTGQLRWDPTDNGFFTANTDGTKAVVGFAAGKEQTLGNVKITVLSPYASVIFTALDKGKTLTDTSSALISAVARASNTGFQYSTLSNDMTNNGKPPIALEPVKATFTIAGRQVQAVNVLDQDGRRTNQTIDVKDGAFSIDTGTQKTMYYEVVFGK
jgi:hypothetical protein